MGHGMAFVQHHQNMDNIQKVSEMVCDDLDGFDFTKAHPKRKLLASKNNETCANIKQLIEEIKADTDLASRQIQCFASECMATKSLEAYKFQALENKSFASGAAEGNCGLTDCEMTAVCSFEMQYKFSD